MINKNNAWFVPEILDSFNDPPKLPRRTLIRRRILENCAYPRHLCKSASFAYRERMCVVAIALNGQISAHRSLLSPCYLETHDSYPTATCIHSWYTLTLCALTLRYKTHKKKEIITQNPKKHQMSFKSLTNAFKM